MLLQLLLRLCTYAVFAQMGVRARVTVALGDGIPVTEGDFHEISAIYGPWVIRHTLGLTFSDHLFRNFHLLPTVRWSHGVTVTLR